MTPVNLLLIAITVIVSWMAFKNRALADRLIRGRRRWTATVSTIA